MLSSLYCHLGMEIVSLLSTGNVSAYTRRYCGVVWRSCGVFHVRLRRAYRGRLSAPGNASHTAIHMLNECEFDFVEYCTIWLNGYYSVCWRSRRISINRNSVSHTILATILIVDYFRSLYVWWRGGNNEMPEAGTIVHCHIVHFH